MPLNYESVDFIEVLGKRRSCRFYDPERAVEPEKTQAICQAARNASHMGCLLYTSPSPRDRQESRMPSSA